MTAAFDFYRNRNSSRSQQIRVSSFRPTNTPTWADADYTQCLDFSWTLRCLGLADWRDKLSYFLLLLKHYTSVLVCLWWTRESLLHRPAQLLALYTARCFWKAGKILTGKQSKGTGAMTFLNKWGVGKRRGQDLSVGTHFKPWALRPEIKQRKGGHLAALWLLWQRTETSLMTFGAKL